MTTLAGPMEPTIPKTHKVDQERVGRPINTEKESPKTERKLQTLRGKQTPRYLAASRMLKVRWAKSEVGKVPQADPCHCVERPEINSGEGRGSPGDGDKAGGRVQAS